MRDTQSPEELRYECCGPAIYMLVAASAVSVHHLMRSASAGSHAARPSYMRWDATGCSSFSPLRDHDDALTAPSVR